MKNASKRPANWKSVNAGTSEMAAPMIDSGSKVEYLLCRMCFPNNVELLNDPNMWIADTAATVHSMLHSNGLQNPKEATTSDKVPMGNGTDVGVKTITQLPGTICNKHGNELKYAVLNDVTHLPEAKYNLFSLSRMTRHEGWKLGGDKEALWIEKDGMEVCFNIVIPTPKGALYCMYYKRATEMAMAATERGTKMNIAKAHSLLGHCNEDMTQSAAKSMGWVLTGSLRPCKSCAAVKAKQKNVPKASEHKKAVKGKNHIFLDIVTINKKVKEGPLVLKPNWQIMVDEWTGMKFFGFLLHEGGNSRANLQAVA